MFNYKYIPKDQEQNLRDYKYSGGEASLIYKYIISPLAEKIVNTIVPTWMAPNLITLIGFGCVFFPWIALWILVDGNLNGNIPAWFCIILGLLQFTYLVIDNVDGKQARKTGSSSPLGLLFDHGCDAINLTLSGVNIVTVLQLGNNWKSILGIAASLCPFYFATWEEYYVNALILPIINGATEGPIVLAVIFIASGIVGTQIWSSNVGAGLTVVDVNLIIIVLFGLVSTTNHILNVRAKVPEQFKKALMNTIPFLITLIVIAYVTIVEQNDMVVNQTRLLIVYFGLHFGKLATHLQAAHVANVEFQGFRRTTLISYTILVAYVLIKQLVKGYTHQINDRTVLLVLIFFALLSYIHLVVNIVLQFTDVLNIKCFKIRPKDAALVNKSESKHEELVSKI